MKITDERVTHQIIPCPKCKGVGEVSEAILVNAHKRDYRTEHKTCLQCAGTGRLNQTIIVRTEPFEPRAKDAS